jgi:hypothetical protein
MALSSGPPVKLAVGVAFGQKYSIENAAWRASRTKSLLEPSSFIVTGPTSDHTYKPSVKDVLSGGQL